MSDLGRRITGKALIDALREALGIDTPYVQRIVLDVTVRDKVVAYVEIEGTTRLVEINWAEHLADVVTVTHEETNEIAE